MNMKSVKLQIYYSLKYLLTHEDYIDLNINQKINSKKLCFDFDRKFNKSDQAVS